MITGFVCEWCGVLEHKDVPIEQNGKMFCRKKCYNKYLKWKKEEFTRHNRYTKYTNVAWKLCSICNTTHLNKEDFCSAECSVIYYKQHGLFCQRTNVLHKCRNCGKLINLNSVFCDYKCNGKYYSGERSPGWKGGLSFAPYCYKFNDDLRLRVRLFFYDECFLCGMKTKFNSKALAVHHVTYNKNTGCDNTTPIFVPLCNSCHGKTNYNREFWQNLITERLEEEYNSKCYFTKNELDDLIEYIESLG